MNKIVRFILIPFLAALFVFSARANYLSLNKVTYSSRFSQVSALYKFHTASGVHRKGIPQINKKIRIKACDDAIALGFTAPVPHVVFYPVYVRIVYGGYRLYYELDAHSSSSLLRGPPAA